MRKFLLRVLKSMLIGACMGSLAFFLLTHGDAESVSFGAIIGGVPGVLLGICTGLGIGRQPSAFTGHADSNMGFGHNTPPVLSDMGGFDGGGFDDGGFDVGEGF